MEVRELREILSNQTQDAEVVIYDPDHGDDRFTSPISYFLVSEDGTVILHSLDVD